LRKHFSQRWLSAPPASPFLVRSKTDFLLLGFADAARAGREDGPNAIGDTDMTVDFVTVVFCASPVRGTRRHDLAAGLA